MHESKYGFGAPKIITYFLQIQLRLGLILLMYIKFKVSCHFVQNLSSLGQKLVNKKS